jgi:hypothetical protein
MVLSGTGVLVLAGLLVGLWLLVRHEPAFYRQSAAPAGPERRRASKRFQEQFFNMVQRIAYPDRHPWGVELPQDQINAYFAEDFLKLGNWERNLPQAIREPRVAILPNQLRLGFRYGQPPWSTVISLDLNIWLVPSEPNALALEVQRVCAGALPIAGQSLLENIVEALRRQDIEVTWYRRSGRPVALLRFQADQRRPTVQLCRLVLQLQEGKILVGDPTGMPPRSAVAPASLTAN